MRTVLMTGAASLLFAVSTPVSAKGAETDTRCANSGTTVEYVACYSAAAKQADKDLNTLYGRILSVLPGKDRTRLQKAERAWIAYRDAACDAEYGLFDGGTGGPPAHLACLGRETRQHSEYLAQAYRLRLQHLDL